MLVAVSVCVCVKTRYPELRTINGGVRTKQEAGMAQGDRLPVPFSRLWPNHDVAPGNGMSPWPRANLRICARPASNQELKNWCVGSLSLSPLLVQFHFLAVPADSLIPISNSWYFIVIEIPYRCAHLCCPCPLLPPPPPFCLHSTLLYQNYIHRDYKNWTTLQNFLKGIQT